MSSLSSVWIPVQPVVGAEPLMCSQNVQKRVSAMGGTAVFGWEINRQPYTIVKVSHCVWQDQTGQLWDVTPHFAEIDGAIAVIKWPERTEFERDDAAGFKGKSLPNRHIPVHPSPHVARACEFMERADRFLYAGDLERCRYWTDRANKEMRNAGLRCGWSTPSSLSLEDFLVSEGKTK